VEKLPKFLEENEVKAIVLTLERGTGPLQARNRALVKLLIQTGIRVSELCDIKLNDINFTENRILINGKGSKQRFVYFSDQIHDELNRWMVFHPGGKWLFCTLIERKAGQVKGNRMDRNTVYHLVRRLGKKAGLSKPLHPHMFRHTCGTQHLRNGTDITVIQRILGHSRIETTTIYAKVADKTVETAMKNYLI
jgi:site-specific recombinase XerD